MAAKTPTGDNESFSESTGTESPDDLGRSTAELSRLSVDELAEDKAALAILVRQYTRLVDENSALRDEARRALDEVEELQRTRSPWPAHPFRGRLLAIAAVVFAAAWFVAGASVLASPDPWTMIAASLGAIVTLTLLYLVATSLRARMGRAREARGLELLRVDEQVYPSIVERREALLKRWETPR